MGHRPQDPSANVDVEVLVVGSGASVLVAGWDDSPDAMLQNYLFAGRRENDERSDLSDAEE